MYKIELTAKELLEIRRVDEEERKFHRNSDDYTDADRVKLENRRAGIAWMMMAKIRDLPF